MECRGVAFQAASSETRQVAGFNEAYCKSDSEARSACRTCLADEASGGIRVQVHDLVVVDEWRHDAGIWSLEMRR